MKINIKARLKNKVFIASFSALVIGFVYTILSVFDIVPKIEQEKVIEIVSAVISALGMLGVLADPTTDGISDSDRAMTYCTDKDVRKCEVEENE